MKRLVRFAAAIATVTLARRRWVVPLVLMQALFLLPLCVGFPSGFEGIKLEAQQNLDLADGQLASGAYAGVPQDVVDGVVRRREILGSALSEPDGSAAQLSGLADYYDLAAAADGSSADEEMRALDVARSTLLRSIASLEKPEVYQTARQMPAIYYLAHSPWIIPGPLVGIAVVAGVASALGVLCDGRLLSRAPVGEVTRWLCAYVVMLGLAVAFLVLAMLPAALVATTLSGVGSPGYPVVSVLDGVIVESTVGQVLSCGFALMFAGMAWCLGLATLVVAALGSSAAGKAASLVCLVLPLAPFYQAPGMPWQALLRYLPMTYLSTSGIVGAPLYVNGSEMRAVSGATFGLGLLVCAASALALLATVAVLSVGRDAAWGRRRGAVPGGVSERPGGMRQGRSAGLRLADFSAGYGRRRVVRASDFELVPGLVVGLVAPNGSGKSTLMEAVSEPWRRGAAGAVTNAGRVGTRAGARAATGVGTRAEWRQSVLLVPGTQVLYPWLTGRRHMRLACELWGSGAKGDKISKALGSDEFLDIPVHTCSQGMAQLVCLTVALCTGARCLLLDEPMSALDFTNVQVVSGVLRSYARDGRAVLMSTHNVANADVSCDRIAWIVDGEVECDERPVGERPTCAEEYERRYGVGHEPVAGE